MVRHALYSLSHLLALGVTIQIKFTGLSSRYTGRFQVLKSHMWSVGQRQNTATSSHAMFPLLPCCACYNSFPTHQEPEVIVFPQTQ